jgi:DNA-directed RNA polymerase I subunit RPA1
VNHFFYRGEKKAYRNIFCQHQLIRATIHLVCPAQRFLVWSTRPPVFPLHISPAGSGYLVIWSKMNISQPVPSAIGSVDFGFLDAAEIKTLSVKKIQNPVTFDTLLHPIPGGLYDPALGAWGDNL